MNTDISQTTVLSSDEVALITSKNTPVQLNKGDYVFRAGAPGKHIYLLNKGRIKLFRTSSTGKENTLWFCFPGEMFGLSELTANQRRSVYAQCCEASEVTAISFHNFHTLLHESSSIALKIIEQLSLRLKVAGDTLINVTSDDARSRIIKLLLRLSMRFGADYQHGKLIDVVITHKELADMVGSCRQTVTTIMGDLKRDGLIEFTNHRIFIHSVTTLEQAVAEKITPQEETKKINKLLASV